MPNKPTSPITPNNLPGPPAITDAYTLDQRTIELTFTEPVRVNNSAAAASKFVLSGNHLDYGLDYNVITTGGPDQYPMSVSGTVVRYGFESTGVIGAVTAVRSVSGEPSKLRLHLNTLIAEDHDGNTGMLRLIYTNGADSITDTAGDRLADIPIPPPEVRGNVRDTIGRPSIIDARATTNRTIQLTFNKPVTTTDAPPNYAGLAGSFQIYGRRLQAGTSSAYFDLYSASPSGPIYGEKLSFTPKNRRVTINLTGPIPAHWDHDGYLSLLYTSQQDADPMPRALDGAFLDFRGPYQSHRGNLKDFE